MTPRPDLQAGFSLIEALVAMAVLAVGATGLMAASANHVDTVRSLEARATAQWAAENAAIELSLAGRAPEQSSSTVQMLGSAWTVAVNPRSGADPELAAFEVKVGPGGSAPPMAALTGFVDTGARAPSPPAA